MRFLQRPLLTLVLMLLCYLSISAQPDPNTSLSVTNPDNSDYRFLVTFDYNPNYCDCSQSTTINIYEQIAFLGPIIATYSSPQTNVAFIVGPGYDENVAAAFFMSGERSWPGFSPPGNLCATASCPALPHCDCGDAFGVPTTHITTSSLKNPTNVSASSGTYGDRIILTWGKGTNFPNNEHDYIIYRDGDSLTTVSGSGPYTYTDLGLPQGVDHDYTIKTHITSFGDQESSGVTVSGSTFAIDATDGNYYGRVRVTWSNVPANTEDIRIERSLHNAFGVQVGVEELAIMNANATAFNDNGGVPGFAYTYYIKPLDSNGSVIITYTDTGYSKPNGKISGHIRSQVGVGVLGIDVEVTLQDAIPAGGGGLPGGCAVTYCATTDVDGFYEIPDVYYYTEADFEIKPLKSGHVFTPDSVVRTLSENGNVLAGIDFTDETVFTVGGRVTWPEYENDSCGIKNAVIRIDTSDFGIKTDVDGYWVFTLFNQGFYEFSVDYYDHRFENILGQTTSTVYIDTDVLDIDFIDMETGDIQVIAQGGCQTPLGDSVQVRVEAPENCWNELYWTNPDGTLTIEDVPARDYTVKVIDIAGAAQPTNILNQIGELGGVEIDIDLTSKDSIYMRMDYDTTIITPESYDTLPNSVVIVTPADTQLITVQDSILKPVNSTARFIYRSPLDIGIDFANAGANVLDGCMNSEGENIILMEKGVEYPLLIDVRESLNMQCPIDSGYLKIYDNIGDLEDNPVRIPIVNGLAEYHVVAGNPVIATSPVHNHEKFLYIVPEVDQLDAEPFEFWVLVTGVKNNTPSLITRSPEIPLLILHDPPGDNSFAFVEEGQSFRTFTTTSYLSSDEEGGYLNIGGGLKGDIFSVSIKLGAFANIAISGGKNEKNEDGFETVLTFTQQYSTSSADNFAGEEGDVYIGASFNQEFSIGESLMYDENSCTAEKDSIPQLDLAGFATTFYYTEKHIKQTLLPTIALLMKEFKEGSPASTTEEDSIRFNRLRADSVSWVRILDQNALGRDSMAVFDENITFSAGATVSKTFSTNETSSHTYEYESFVNEEFEVGGLFEFEGFGAYIETKAGFMAKFKQTWAGSTGNDTTTTRTVGYVLDDGDIGDFFSVDVKRDTFFNVPAFDLVLGTSSCPQEEGTQARDKPTIRILEPQADDVPINEAATFTVQLNNESESGETREYHVRVVSTTNPEGALFDLGGRNINNGPATFFLEKNQMLNVQLSVKKGPLASNYEHMGVMIYPPCEYALWQDNGVLKNVDTAYVTVNFQSACTNVSLYNPGDGWLVNQNDNDILHTTFTGYNINNQYFEGLTLQLKREGEGYVNQVTIPKEDIAGPYYDVFLDVSNFDDGNYRLRARANCQAGAGYTYSSEQKGIIDRASLAPFGMPSPSDGFLQAGQEISVSYDKEINCNLGTYPTEISLVRNDTDIPLAFTTECLGNKLIIVTDPPLVEVPDLDGVEVTARVHLLEDLNGNIQKYPVEWTFKVNSKPVFWDPEMLYTSANEGQTTIITGVLKNDALISKSFSLEVADAPGIIEYPEWLTPMQTRGTVLSNSFYNVDFAVDPELSPGIYQGIVTAVVDSLPVSMQVVYELFAKPVNWQFDPAQYENSMNVVAQFSLTQADIPLSDDPRDLIGAFVNGEIRGVANIEWVPGKNVYAAFLTVYSDDDGGSNAEEISFHYWKALSGIEYKAVETLPFQINGAIGTASSPFILHPDGIFQIIPLNAGWNWISFNVENSDMSREHIFESVISSKSTNTILIKSQTQTAEYNPSSGWSGSLKNLAIGNGYLVHLSDHFDTLRVAGFPPAGPVLINVSNAWNWIGFPEQEPRMVDDVLDGLVLTDGDLLKSQHAFAAYDDGISNWVGNLKTLEPGMGYKLNLQSNGIVEYELLEESADPSLFEFNMNVTAVLDPDILDHSQAEDLLVSAYISGVRLGEADVEYVSALNAYRALLLINGAAQMQDARVEFRVENTHRNTLYFSNGEPVQFTLDGITGTVLEPYKLFRYQPESHAIDGEEYELFQNIPNPMRESTLIQFRIPGPKEVAIEIFDGSGALINRMTNEYAREGLYGMEVSLEGLPPGIYYYRMTTDTFSGVKKLVKE